MAYIRTLYNGYYEPSIEIHECDECGKQTDEITEVNGRDYCPDCLPEEEPEEDEEEE
jgi:hypothetical protein